jgi:hypothetical protein
MRPDEPLKNCASDMNFLKLFLSYFTLPRGFIKVDPLARNLVKVLSVYIFSRKAAHKIVFGRGALQLGKFERSSIRQPTSHE